jgi:hypothetical protein
MATAEEMQFNARSQPLGYETTITRGYYFIHRLDNPDRMGVFPLRGGDWVWLAQSLSPFWLTTYWLASPVTADPRGVAEERPALPKVGVPSSLSRWIE